MAEVAIGVSIALLFLCVYKIGWFRGAASGVEEGHETGYKAGYMARKTQEHAQNYGRSDG